MIKEAYVSDEVAKLLSQKGFHKPCTGLNKIAIRDNEQPVLKITQQKAMAWLIAVYNKYCDVGYDIDLKWYCQIVDLKETVRIDDYDEMKIYHLPKQCEYESYEEAIEAAIKYCLENLI